MENSGQAFKRIKQGRFIKRSPKDAIYKMIGFGLCAISTVTVFAAIYLASVNLIPTAIDAILDCQQRISLQAQGRLNHDEDDILVQQ